MGDDARRLPAARGRGRAHGAVLPRRDARPRPAGGRAGRGGGGDAGPLHGPAGPRRRRQALRRRRDRDAHRLPGRAVRRPARLPRRAHLGAGAPRRGVVGGRGRAGSSCTTTPSATRPSRWPSTRSRPRGPERRKRRARRATSSRTCSSWTRATTRAWRRSASSPPCSRTGSPRTADYDRELRRLIGARADHQYPMRSLLRAGVTVAGASDYPVSPPPDPLLAIQRGVLRRDPLRAGDERRAVAGGGRRRRGR